MLNSDTKRHIDAARDVLVGVAPNPTTQIDQITYALIYKFMDDMDQASVKAGGEASFFVGTLKKYAWSNLVSSKMGNQEKMDLYSEALTKFSEAKQLPELFRAIFRAAFLPYRSPETLGLFLKEISYFDYSHPEELGNAYEYLLSIMSSQGDAGQFRTPRHIIDFIVDVINPTKDDKVLDPACGTGGFLVSTYNHILEQHDGKDDPKKKEKPLTPDERKKLMSNLQGYDIDPTMVRIAQVNMYLHQFKNPQIFQYDTLTSEERWNDKFDVILANPPFMSPKGGIKPHNKFGVSSNRAEVLFVDYIITHLKPKGRAGIIVPEGIIFQSGNAYKALRKSLLENGLFAVVSLPGGVFQPYSGVKTSILLIDPEMAKLGSDVAFIKVTADGFDLGSTKKAIQDNDLPSALNVLRNLREGRAVESPLISFVSRGKVAESGDYNLSGEKYKDISIIRETGWPLVPLGDCVNILNGFAFKSELYSDKGTRVIRITNVQKGYIKDDQPKYYPEAANAEIAKYFLQENDLLVSLTGNVGRVALLPKEFLPAALNQRVACLRVKNSAQISERYLFHLLNLDNFEEECIRASSGVAQKNLSTEWLKGFEIPLPPLEIQQKYVRELDAFAAISSGAKQVVDNWRASIEVNPEWIAVPLGELVEILDSKRKPITKSDRKKGKFPYYGATGILDHVEGYIFKERLVLLGEDGAKWEPGENSAFIAEGKYWVNNHAHVLKPNRDLLDDVYLVTLLNQMDLMPFVSGVTVPKLNQTRLREIKIPLPPLRIQQELALQIESERAYVESANRLIEIFNAKKQLVIAKLWSA